MEEKTQKKKRSLGARNKHKGSHAERFYARLFRELGFSHCQTARLGSKLHDNAGIDLVFLPFNVQVKAGIQKGLNPGKVLFQMRNQINVLFPKEDPCYQKKLLVIHRPEAFSAGTEKDVVYMAEEEFLSFKGDIPLEIKYEFFKKRKDAMNSPYSTIIGISFNVFKELIIMKYARDN